MAGASPISPALARSNGAAPLLRPEGGMVIKELTASMFVFRQDAGQWLTA